MRKIVVSVKGGGIKPDGVRALNHVWEQEKAEIALFVSLKQPTSAMVKDADSVGFYTSMAGKKFSRVQLLTNRRVAERDATRRASRLRAGFELQESESGTGFRAADVDLSQQRRGAAFRSNLA